MAIGRKPGAARCWACANALHVTHPKTDEALDSEATIGVINVRSCLSFFSTLQCINELAAAMGAFMAVDVPRADMPAAAWFMNGV